MNSTELPIDSDSYLQFIPLEQNLIKILPEGQTLKDFQCLYDKTSRNIVFLKERDLFILNYHGNLIAKIKLEQAANNNKLTFISFEESNHFVLLVFDYKNAYMHDLHYNVQYPVIKPCQSKELLLGMYYFSEIDQSSQNQKDKILVLSTGALTLNEYSPSYKNDVMSTNLKNVFNKKYTIENFIYNQESNILVTKKGEYFKVFNLKNLLVNFSGNQHEIKANNYTKTSKFYLEVIYNKLYLVQLNDNIIMLYYFDLLSNQYKKKKISFNLEGDSTFNNLQFYNNLIILHSNCKCFIYDIKQKNQNSPIIVQLKNNTNIKTLSCYGNIIKWNDKLYKIKFNCDYFYNNSSFSTYDKVLLLLKRKKSLPYINKIFINLIQKHSIVVLRKIFSKICKIFHKAEKGKKVDKSKSSNNDYVTETKYYLSPDDLFNIFTDKNLNYDHPEKILMIFSMLSSLFIINELKINENFFHSFEYIIKDLEDYSVLDLLVKNKCLPFKLQLAKVFIRKSINSQKIKEQKFYINLALHILINSNSPEEGLFLLLQNNKINEVLDLLYTFYESSYAQNSQKQGRQHIDEFIKSILRQIDLNSG